MKRWLFKQRGWVLGMAMMLAARSETCYQAGEIWRDFGWTLGCIVCIAIFFRLEKLNQATC